MLQKMSALFFCITVVAGSLLAQGWWDSKSYTAWSKAEVTKMLDKSPWGVVLNRSIERIGQQQVNPIINPTQGVSAEASPKGELAYDKFSLHISLVTAKPVRMALARRAILADPNAAGKIDWEGYVDQEDLQNIIVVVNSTAATTNWTLAYTLSRILGSLTTDDLASQTFLSIDGKKKALLAKYDGLGENGYGVKFCFPRNLPDGSPLVAPGDKEMRFHSIIPLPRMGATGQNSIAVDAKWDLRKMTYKGKLCF